MSLEIVIGPMFSGKTTHLNIKLTSYADQGYSVIKIIHSADNRDGNTKGSTHNSCVTIGDKVDIVKTDMLSKIDISKYHIIGIDESQFFPDLADIVALWIETKQVLVVGIDGDSNRKKFGQILDLIPLCDKIQKLSSACSECFESDKRSGNIKAPTPAPFTVRKSTDVHQICVGGSEIYRPSCRLHYTP